MMMLMTMKMITMTMIIKMTTINDVMSESEGEEMRARVII